MLEIIFGHFQYQLQFQSEVAVLKKRCIHSPPPPEKPTDGIFVSDQNQP